MKSPARRTGLVRFNPATTYSPIPIGSGQYHGRVGEGRALPRAARGRPYRNALFGSKIRRGEIGRHVAPPTAHIAHGAIYLFRFVRMRHLRVNAFSSSGTHCGRVI